MTDLDNIPCSGGEVTTNMSLRTRNLLRVAAGLLITATLTIGSNAAAFATFNYGV
jgi:hypothetical protein